MDDDQGSSQNEPEMVPSARLREESAKKREAQARVAELQAQIAELSPRAATADTLAKQLEEAKAAHAADRTTWDEERAVYAAGITDPDGVTVARTLYGRQPAEGRPPLAEWVKSDERARKALAAYLAPGAPPPPPVAPKQGAQATTTTASAGATLTDAQIREIRSRALATGDWSEWAAYRKRAG